MKANYLPLLSPKDQTVLQDALYYMKMPELKKACMILSLPDKGKKSELIERIFVFIKNGRITESPQIQEKSLAKNHPFQGLKPSSLMLYGAYKNDLKARNFFKEIIGPHFHFTAYGIDWLNKRWQQGCPPTYQEFADYWIKETDRHTKEKPKPKDEWMFIRFMQMMQKKEPQTTNKDLMQSWKAMQAQKAEEGFQLLNKAVKVLK